MLYGALNAAEVPTPLAEPLERLPANVETSGAAGTHGDGDGVALPLAARLAVTDGDARDAVREADRDALPVREKLPDAEREREPDGGMREGDTDVEAAVLADTDALVGTHAPARTAATCAFSSALLHTRTSENEPKKFCASAS